MELPSASIEIPATVSDGKILPYGLTEPLSKDESIEIGKIPLQFPKVLGLKTEKNAKMVDYDILHSKHISLKIPETQVMSIPVSQENLHRKFDDWWNSVPGYLKEKTKPITDYPRPVVLFNAINDALHESHFHPKEIETPSRSELKDWFQEIGI